ncbi:MAG: hypothetical protein MK168_02685 [Candidatus Thalassarchaeum sp.]|nr:hypothetical protein [Candidatus Thalassarchaeum sp.]
MVISPRSRWSNRDDSSYGEKPEQKNWRPSIHKWIPVRWDSGTPMLFIGQAIGIAALAMLYSGIESVSETASSDAVRWGSGESAFLATLGFSVLSALILFRVSRSRKVTKGRRRIARLSILSLIGTCIYIFSN